MFYCMLENIVQFCYWPATQWISVQQILSKSKQRGKHALVELSFLTKYLRLNNIESSTLNRRNSINVVSTLFCQHWNNVDKHTSAQLSFSTKYQRWNNVDERWWSTLFQRWFNVDVFAGMFSTIMTMILSFPIIIFHYYEICVSICNKVSAF